MITTMLATLLSSMLAIGNTLASRTNDSRLESPPPRWESARVRFDPRRGLCETLPVLSRSTTGKTKRMHVSGSPRSRRSARFRLCPLRTDCDAGTHPPVRQPFELQRHRFRGGGGGTLRHGLAPSTGAGRCGRRSRPIRGRPPRLSLQFVIFGAKRDPSRTASPATDAIRHRSKPTAQAPAHSGPVRQLCLSVGYCQATRRRARYARVFTAAASRHAPHSRRSGRSRSAPHSAHNPAARYRRRRARTSARRRSRSGGCAARCRFCASACRRRQDSQRRRSGRSRAAPHIMHSSAAR